METPNTWLLASRNMVNQLQCLRAILRLKDTTEEFKTCLKTSEYDISKNTTGEYVMCKEATGEYQTCQKTRRANMTCLKTRPVKI